VSDDRCPHEDVSGEVARRAPAYPVGMQALWLPAHPPPPSRPAVVRQRLRMHSHALANASAEGATDDEVASTAGLTGSRGLRVARPPSAASASPNQRETARPRRARSQLVPRTRLRAAGERARSSRTAVVERHTVQWGTYLAGPVTAQLMLTLLPRSSPASSGVSFTSARPLPAAFRHDRRRLDLDRHPAAAQLVRLPAARARRRLTPGLRAGRRELEPALASHASHVVDTAQLIGRHERRA
jgi:hypothetical protein